MLRALARRPKRRSQACQRLRPPLPPRPARAQPQGPPHQTRARKQRRSLRRPPQQRRPPRRLPAAPPRLRAPMGWRPQTPPRRARPKLQRLLTPAKRRGCTLSSMLGGLSIRALGAATLCFMGSKRRYHCVISSCGSEKLSRAAKERLRLLTCSPVLLAREPGSSCVGKRDVLGAQRPACPGLRPSQKRRCVCFVADVIQMCRDLRLPPYRGRGRRRRGRRGRTRRPRRTRSQAWMRWTSASAASSAWSRTRTLSRCTWSRSTWARRSRGRRAAGPRAVAWGHAVTVMGRGYGLSDARACRNTSLPCPPCAGASGALEQGAGGAVAGCASVQGGRPPLRSVRRSGKQTAVWHAPRVRERVGGRCCAVTGPMSWGERAKVSEGEGAARRWSAAW